MVIGVLLIAAGALAAVVPFAFETGVLTIKETISRGRPLQGEERFVVAMDMVLGCIAGPALGLLGVLLIGIGIGQMAHQPVEPFATKR